MNDPAREAIRRLRALCGLSEDSARHALSEVMDAFSYSVDEYIVARHGELHHRGLRNPEIFERIALEIRALRFRAPPLTPRQIRRRVYG